MDDAEHRFLRLIRENRARLERVCRVYANGPESRRDLRQKILLQVWRSFSSFRGEAAEATWLYRVAINTAISERRYRGARPEVELEDADRARPSPGRQPDRHAHECERLERLYRAIRQLDETDRAVVTMYLEESDYDEIGAVMGMSRNNVGVRLNRIRKKLSRLLEEEL